MKKCFILGAAVLFVSVNLWADTITFKSGKKVDGSVKSITDNTVTVEIYGVTEMTYDLTDIQEINGQLIEVPAPAADTGVNTDEEPVSQAAPEEEDAEAITFEEAPQTPAFEPGDIKMMTGVGAMAIMTFLGIILLVFLAFYAYLSICIQFIAKKTGTEPAWLAWIPIANMFLVCKIAGLSYLWLLAFLVPFVNVLVSIYMWYRISEARGKPGLLALLMLVPVANFVFMGYLAFSRSETGTIPPPVKGEEPASPYQDRPYRPPLE